MTPKQRFFKTAEDLGCVVDDTSDSQEFLVTVDAPRGKVLRFNGCHATVGWEFKGSGDSAGFWNDMTERLSLGLEDCQQSNCEVCDE